jgi:uncharacterized protein (TIGR03437 family)
MRKHRKRIYHVLAALVAFSIPLPQASAQFVQQGDKLVGADTMGEAEQGTSVALSADGNTAIVGGPNDNAGAGAVWVFTRSGDTWSQQGSKLIGTGAIGSSGQGTSVALSADGDTAIVGGPGDDNGAGAVWVFTRLGGMWSQQGSKLIGTGASAWPAKGSSVALSADGNTAIVGGPGDDTGGVGAVWVFTRSGGVWSQQGSKLIGTGASGWAGQGASVALSADGNTVMVGGPWDSNVGAAWVFTRLGGVWRQQGSKLIGTGVAQGLDITGQGTSVALSADGNTGVVGGPWDNEVSDYYGVGAAWVFTRSGGVWTQQGSKLVGTGGAYVSGKDGVAQGWAVALSSDGNTAIVGGPCDDNSGKCYDKGAAGAAWAYTRSGIVWTQTGSKLLGTGALGSARQGTSVALSADGYTAILGGPADDAKTGAAWIYVKDRGLSTINPSITSGGVVNGASFLPGIAPGTWITIRGSNLSTTTRIWGAADFSGNNLPTQLDGVSVTVNGKPGYVYYISPTQLNVLAPDDSARGSVPVQVTVANVKSNVENAVESALSPGLFTFTPAGGKYAAAVRADGVYLTPPNLFPGLATASAKPGDIILLFGTGFGPTSPPVPIGQTINSAPLAGAVTVRIGGVQAMAQYAGVVSPGLFQFNIVVPAVPNGDNTVSVEIGGVFSQPNVFLNVQR